MRGIVAQTPPQVRRGFTCAARLQPGAGRHRGSARLPKTLTCGQPGCGSRRGGTPENPHLKAGGAGLVNRPPLDGPAPGTAGGQAAAAWRSDRRQRSPGGPDGPMSLMAGAGARSRIPAPVVPKPRTSPPASTALDSRKVSAASRIHSPEPMQVLDGPEDSGT